MRHAVPSRYALRCTPAALGQGEIMATILKRGTNRYQAQVRGKGYRTARWQIYFCTTGSGAEQTLAALGGISARGRLLLYP